MPKNQPIEQRLNRYTIDSDTNCHLWQGALNNAGYGLIRHNDKMKTVHRVVYELNHGPIPADKIVGHTCHIKNCMNPDHLELMTHKEKINSMQKDGIFRRKNIKYKQPLEKCIHCGAVMGKNMIARWHNDKCKHKKDKT